MTHWPPLNLLTHSMACVGVLWKKNWNCRKMLVVDICVIFFKNWFQVKINKIQVNNVKFILKLKYFLKFKFVDIRVIKKKMNFKFKNVQIILRFKYFSKNSISFGWPSYSVWPFNCGAHIGHRGEWNRVARIGCTACCRFIGRARRPPFLASFTSRRSWRTSMRSNCLHREG